tara:strand:- start:73 stop:279 length:207 start_codon:yes stop_codon:yes gene_type:complete
MLGRDGRDNAMFITRINVIRLAVVTRISKQMMHTDISNTSIQQRAQRLHIVLGALLRSRKRFLQEKDS